MERHEASDISERLVDLIGEEFPDYTISMGSIRYGNNSEFKIVFTDAGESNVTEEAWLFNAESFGLDKNWLGQSFLYHGKRYTIIGLKPRSRKYPVLCSNGWNDRRTKFTTSLIISSMKRIDSERAEKNKARSARRKARRSK